MPESNQKYKNILQDLTKDISTTFKIPISNAAKDLIKKSTRIFVTGSGSSYPAAFFAAKYINKYSGGSVILANSSDILDSQSLTETDLIILVSQGWGRADGYLITKKAIQKNCNLIALTGHPERLQTHYPEANKNKIIPLEIKPNDEKIFCRPNSPLTSLIQICRLLEIEISQAKILEIIENVKKISFSNYVSQLLKFKSIVILSSSTSLTACYNVALALREGSGRNTEVHEIESYGHGWYTIDQENRTSTLYILIKHQGHTHSLEAYERIQSLIKNTNSNYLDLVTDLDEIYGNIYVLAFFAHLIPLLNDMTDFDMNNPKGMEENRVFHEIYNENK